jgi:8-amino-7-oxononanoate synthase
MLTLDSLDQFTKGDLILYDELCHASSGRNPALMKAYKFNHNDFEDLEKLILRNPDTTIYIVTESVFQWMVIVQI